MPDAKKTFRKISAYVKRYDYILKAYKNAGIAVRALSMLAVLILLTFLSFFSGFGLMVLLVYIMISVKNSVKTAFADPEDINYKRKTDDELYLFLFQLCISAFLFAVVSYQVFWYIALLFWFYFLIFVLMFARIWKFHGKKLYSYYSVIAVSILLSFAIAPYVRELILKIFNFFNVF